MHKKTIKLKIPIPEKAVVYAENGDKAKDLLLYEVDQLEVLEEVKFDTQKLNFKVKDGQYVKKGDVIFSEGILGHKIMVSDFNGIIEILSDRCRILGQKRQFERRVYFDGEVIRIVPDKFVEFVAHLLPLELPFYTTYKRKLTHLVYVESKKEIQDIKITDFNTTVLVNDNLYMEDVSKLIAFGAKHIIVNGLFVTDLSVLKREIDKIDSFAVLSGFGEFVAKKYTVTSTEQNILWGKNTLYFSSDIDIAALQMFEHPYWGLSGEFAPKNDLVGQLDYNNEVFEFYLKNLGKHE